MHRTTGQIITGKSITYPRLVTGKDSYLEQPIKLLVTLKMY